MAFSLWPCLIKSSEATGTARSSVKPAPPPVQRNERIVADAELDQHLAVAELNWEPLDSISKYVEVLERF